MSINQDASNAQMSQKYQQTIDKEKENSNKLDEFKVEVDKYKRIIREIGFH